MPPADIVDSVPAATLALAPGFAPMFAWDNSYARLPERFFARVVPGRVRDPRLVRVNAGLAAALGLDPTALASPEGIEILAGNRVPAGAAPIATAYAGHQFGGFSPQLGDGRAILLGEIVTPDGTRRDIQLKGAGRTPFSRMGDGRAALGPVLREYLVSEAMAALGVPTTRALAAVATGEVVLRETALPGAVLTRVAASHIRIGTFQYFAARGDGEAVRLLADQVIARHYPEAAAAAHPYRALLRGVIARQARLVASWLLLGFVHGVMNTDNVSIAGETIDYGPCAFLDAYDPAMSFSSIDESGRYAYDRQPGIAQWNLARLAETLLSLLGEEQAEALDWAHAALAGFEAQFQAAWLDGVRRKLGLATAQPEDAALAQDLLQRMAQNNADFTLTFRLLCDAAADPAADAVVRARFADPAAYDAWGVRWQHRLAAEAGAPQARWAAMRASNPGFIPRNHRVEAALEAAVQRQDFAPFAALLGVVTQPYADQPGFEQYALPPEPGGGIYRTFCGT